MKQYCSKVGADAAMFEESAMKAKAEQADTFACHLELRASFCYASCYACIDYIGILNFCLLVFEAKPLLFKLASGA